MSAPVIDRPKTLPSDGGVDRDFWAHVETEFAKSCMATEGEAEVPCEQLAAWLCYSLHSFDSCPSVELFLCEKHMKIAYEWWSAILKHKPPVKCKRCDVDVVGNLSEHLKAIKL